MSDKIKGSCSRCKACFSERVSRVRDGYQGQCPACGCFINFSSESMDHHVRKAMTEERRIRNGFVFKHPEEAERA
jgi:hypothetical protein